MKNKERKMEAGCSALSWMTEDGKCLWGRNLDYDRIAKGSCAAYLPKEMSYYTWGSSMDENLEEENRRKSRYACAGIGFFEMSSTPVLYEGINEEGLMGGQFYYREFAVYHQQARPETTKLQPPFVVFHLLAQCKNIQEVVQVMEHAVTLMDTKLLGTIAPLHWAFCDRTGEMVIIEPDKERLNIYRNTIGVMTNSPGYPWHRLNLLNYAGLRNFDYETANLDETLRQCFSGSGAQGLPGDFSSPSRFLRLAFLKRYGKKGKNEKEGAAYLFRALQNVAFPIGAVKVSEQENLTEYDREIEPYDYTVYTSVMCSQSLRFYWTTYRNQNIRYLDLKHMMEGSQILQFPLGKEPDFQCLSQRIKTNV